MDGTLFKTDKRNAKPFLKWAGGKTQLLPEIDSRLPKEELSSGKIDTYVEPFVGGGAVFFHTAANFENTKNYLCDINQDLVNCYNSVKSDAEKLIEELRNLESTFLSKQPLQRKDYFYLIRAEFNKDRSPAKLIFLNKTCYNGLYRVNRKGGFNVPFGKYKNPTICDADNLLAVSELLKNAEIICGDFGKSKRYIDENTFVYLDPPYRPLNGTSNFTSYSKHNFSEKEQIRLAEFCRHIDNKGAKFLLSNSDPKNEDPKDHFFETHYSKFKIEAVKASRFINCQAAGRGQINELIITNY